ncbi:hypothetical protein UPYG_G00116800 [Umbra pygmaea]|uniref:Ig-like domain-containing protein n=1 Tax=Umbra pygmaea TaxID=75934 RepID=A0ABD0XTN5_UMBPY
MHEIMRMLKSLAQSSWWLLWILTFVKCKIPEIHVTCLFSEDCVLPCSFKPTGNFEISWYRQDVLLLNQSQQDGHQPHQPPRDQNAKMYLLQDQLSRGNASLHLSKCGIKARGRYKCLVNSTLGQQELFVITKVEAPIKMVTMKNNSNKEILCLSKDVFPAPRVQWFTLPKNNDLRPTTQMVANSEGLYSVQSKLNMSKDIVTYICTVNSTYGTQSWRCSLQERELTTEVGQHLSIPCNAPEKLQHFLLTWTFTRANEPTNILSYDSRTRQTINYWGGRAKLLQDQVQMGNGFLQLEHPMSQESTGTYTCTFSGFQSRHVVQTHVNVSSRAELQTALDPAGHSAESKLNMWPIAIVVAVVVVAAVAALLWYRKRRANQRPSGGRPAEEMEAQPMKTYKTPENLPVDNC